MSNSISYIKNNYLDTNLKKIIALGAVVGLGLYSAYRLRVVWYAKKFEGISEISGNKGWGNKVFEDMMRSIGWKSGQAWCSYFVKAVWSKVYAGDREYVQKLISPSVYQTWQNAINDKSGKIKIIDYKTGGTPKAGDIAIWFKYDSNGNYKGGHTGIVVKGNDYSFKTIEGNTNEAGSREGDSVLQKERYYTWFDENFKLKGFIRKKILAL